VRRLLDRLAIVSVPRLNKDARVPGIDYHRNLTENNENKERIIHFILVTTGLYAFGYCCDRPR
jgi:hypothetical protein